VGKTNIHPDDDRGTWPLYDEVTHIPLMVKPPHLPGGLRRWELAQPPDLCPTILEAAGVAPPQEMPGRSLLPLLAERKAPEWDRRFAVSGAGPLRTGSPVTVTDGDWTVCMGAERAPELYHTTDDRAQQDNVAPEYPEKIAELHTGLMELLEKEGAPEEAMEAGRRLPELCGGDPDAKLSADY
jgi:arylsulfatase A-like enzyme